jgi:hypothetical protein
MDITLMTSIDFRLTEPYYQPLASSPSTYRSRKSSEVELALRQVAVDVQLPLLIRTEFVSKWRVHCWYVPLYTTQQHCSNRVVLLCR